MQSPSYTSKGRGEVGARQEGACLVIHDRRSLSWAFDDSLLLGIGETDLTVVLPAIGFLLVALYFCTSALIGTDRGKLSFIGRLLRFGVTIALLSPVLWAELGTLAVGATLVAYRYLLAPHEKGVVT